MATELALSSRTYGYTVAAPETLTDPIANALRGVVASPPRTRSIEDKSSNNSSGGVVALPEPTGAIAIVGGRARYADDEDVDYIVQAWMDPARDPSDIRLVDLALNKISSKGMLALVKAIGQRPGQLKDLDMNSNNLGDAALTAIATHIVGNPDVKIERMDLSTNKFSDAGVIGFVAALRAKMQKKLGTPLRTLLLRQCDLTNSALRAICDMVSDPACTLTSLHISGNDFLELDGIRDVAGAIRANKTLVDLNVSNCFDYVARWDAIVDAVANGNDTLQQFNIAVMGKKADAIAPLDAVLAANKKAALCRVSEVERLKAAHAKEIESIVASHRLREKVLEGRVCALLAELERLRPAAGGSPDEEL